jgi:hypothetical protein
MAVRIACVVLAAAALALGCLGGGGTTRFFALGGSVAGAGPALASLPELGLLVGPMEFPRYLDRPELVRRDGAHQLELDEWSRWGGSLRSDVLRVMADDLGALLGTARVALYPTEPRFPLHYRVQLDLREFEAVDATTLRLRVRWSLVAAADGRAVVVEETAVEQPIASASAEDLVAAHDAALGSATRRIAERLARLGVPASAR